MVSVVEVNVLDGSGDVEYWRLQLSSDTIDLKG